MDEIGLKTIGAVEIETLRAAAAANPRGRSHLLLHSGPDDPVQRLAILAEPHTYVRPHRHSRQWEVLALLGGGADLLLYTPAGRLEQRIPLEATEATLAEIPLGAVHSVVVRETHTLILEVKPGPYRPNEFVGWAPEEGHLDAEAFRHWARTAVPGDSWPA